jgi:hypothetical protein
MHPQPLSDTLHGLVGLSELFCFEKYYSFKGLSYDIILYKFPRYSLPYQLDEVIACDQYENSTLQFFFFFLRVCTLQFVLVGFSNVLSAHQIIQRSYTDQYLHITTIRCKRLTRQTMMLKRTNYVKVVLLCFEKARK